jgi:hypothetical protein
MNDAIAELILNLAIAFFIIWAGFVGWMFAANRKRYRVTCECGHRARTITLTSAKWDATEHMQRCKGKAVVSPLPAADIAKNAAE